MTTPDLAELLADRSRAHRLDGTQSPMKSLADLLAWLETSRLALVSAKCSVPNAADAIVSRPIRGSWWGDPDGALVYGLLEKLATGAPGYLDIVLVASKRTLVHPDLVPLVTSIAAEPGRRERVAAGLPAGARRLIAELEEERGGTSRTPAPTPSGRQDRSALEAALLARSVSVHTSSGRHVAVLEAFGNAPGAAVVSYRTALARLVEAALRSAVVAPEKEVLGWLAGIEPDAARRSEAVDSLACLRLTDGSGVWLAAQQQG